MTRQEFDSSAAEQLLEILTEHGLDGLQEAMAILLNEAMKIERSRFLGAGPYERAEDRRGYANGFKDKTLKTRVGELALAIPQVRDLEPGTEGFYPKALERGTRAERALVCALAEMYVQGVSTRKVAAITEQLCGYEVTSSQVSRAAKTLDEQLQRWRERPLGVTPYLVLDARYERVRHEGQVISTAVLIAIGVTEDGKRRILGVSVKLSEAEAHWRDFLRSLKERGLEGIRLVVSDDHEGLRAAREAVFGSVPWQRCQFHLQRNAGAYVPRAEMRQEVAQAIRAIFNAEDRRGADEALEKTVNRYQKSAPQLAKWMETAIPEGLAIFAFPAAHRRRLRTTNALERLNEEIRRRTRVVRIFPNTDSLLRLASAVLAEYDDDWETGRNYLNMRAE